MAEQAEEIRLRQISPDDKVRGFFLGDKDFPQRYVPLTIFLQKDAKKHHKENVSKTYVAISEKKILGYISLSCSVIVLDTPPVGLDTYKYKSYPAVKIGKLAVDTHYRKRDLGSKLVSLAVATVKDNVMPNVGCRFIIVDSHQDAIEFYKKQGFLLLETEENKTRPDPIMFLDIGKLSG